MMEFNEIKEMLLTGKEISIVVDTLRPPKYINTPLTPSDMEALVEMLGQIAIKTAKAQLLKVLNTRPTEQKIREKTRQKINTMLIPSGFSIGSCYINNPDEENAEYFVCDSDGDEIDIDSLKELMKTYMTPDESETKNKELEKQTNPKVIGAVSLADIEKNCERIELEAYREIYADIVNRLNEAVILHNEIKPNGNVMIKGGAVSEILKEYTLKLREITLKCQSPKGAK